MNTILRGLQVKRQQFLGAGAALTAAAWTPRVLFALDKDNAYRKAIGIQLYTLRNQIHSDVAGTIKAVADAGYKRVEPYGFPDAKPIIEVAAEAGVAHCHVEQDQSPDPLASIRQSIDHLKTL